MNRVGKQYRVLMTEEPGSLLGGVEKLGDYPNQSNAN